MKRKSYKKMTRSRKTKGYPGIRRIIVLSIVLLVVLVGVYLLKGSSRADTVPDNTIVLSDVNSSGYNDYSGYKVNPQSGKVHIYIEVPNTPAGITQTHFSLFLIVNLRAHNFTCASGYVCDFKDGGYTGIESVYDYDASNNRSQVNFCVPLKTGDAGRGFVIGTLNFDPASAVHQDFSEDFRQDFYSAAVFAAGPCQEPPPDKWFGESSLEDTYHVVSVKADWGERGTGGCVGAECGGGDGDGNGGNGDGDGTGGTGTGDNGTGTGLGPSPRPGSAGNAGALATRHGSNPNSVPSATNQGNQQQPIVEPSPFFDGKLFTLGSNTSDSSNNKVINIGGFKIGYGWIYLLIGLAIAGVGGFFGWRLVKHRRERT